MKKQKAMYIGGKKKEMSVFPYCLFMCLYLLLCKKIRDNQGMPCRLESALETHKVTLRHLIIR